MYVTRLAHSIQSIKVLRLLSRNTSTLVIGLWAFYICFIYFLSMIHGKDIDLRKKTLGHSRNIRHITLFDYINWILERQEKEGKSTSQRMCYIYSSSNAMQSR